MDLCSVCQKMGCKQGRQDLMPKQCPSFQPLVNDVAKNYQDEETWHFMQVASQVEKQGYTNMVRIEKMLAFIQQMGYRKVGFAFCCGLKKEMEELHRIFSGRGFELHSINCKCGGLSKDNLGARELYWNDPTAQEPGCETMCNPIGQAHYLAQCGTEFNIVVGLCVGHDSLFFQHSQAPVSVLAAKDWITGHQPLAPVYLLDGYYKRLLEK